MAWYARHAPTLRAAQVLLAETRGELTGALTTSQAVSYRDNAHYTAIKWVLEDEAFLPTLVRMRDELLGDVDASAAGLLPELRRAVDTCLDFAHATFTSRDDYSQIRSVEGLRHQVGGVLQALEAVRAAVDDALLRQAPAP